MIASELCVSLVALHWNGLKTARFDVDNFKIKKLLLTQLDSLVWP